MTVQAQQLLENKIRELRATLTSEQWADADFLIIHVKELEKTDVTFAFRLMQRVKNLSPTDSNQHLLKVLRKEALTLHPELAMISTVSVSSVMN